MFPRLGFRNVKRRDKLQAFRKIRLEVVKNPHRIVISACNGQPGAFEERVIEIPAIVPYFGVRQRQNLPGDPNIIPFERQDDGFQGANGELNLRDPRPRHLDLRHHFFRFHLHQVLRHFLKLRLQRRPFQPTVFERTQFRLVNALKGFSSFNIVGDHLPRYEPRSVQPALGNVDRREAGVVFDRASELPAALGEVQGAQEIRTQYAEHVGLSTCDKRRVD